MSNSRTEESTIVKDLFFCGDKTSYKEVVVCPTGDWRYDLRAMDPLIRGILRTAVTMSGRSHFAITGEQVKLNDKQLEQLSNIGPNKTVLDLSYVQLTHLFEDHSGKKRYKLIDGIDFTKLPPQISILCLGGTGFDNLEFNDRYDLLMSLPPTVKIVCLGRFDRPRNFTETMELSQTLLASKDLNVMETTPRDLDVDIIQDILPMVNKYSILYLAELQNKDNEEREREKTPEAETRQTLVSKMCLFKKQKEDDVTAAPPAKEDKQAEAKPFSPK